MQPTSLVVKCLPTRRAMLQPAPCFWLLSAAALSSYLVCSSLISLDVPLSCATPESVRRLAGLSARRLPTTRGLSGALFSWLSARLTASESGWLTRDDNTGPMDFLRFASSAAISLRRSLTPMLRRCADLSTAVLPPALLAVPRRPDILPRQRLRFQKLPSAFSS